MTLIHVWLAALLAGGADPSSEGVWKDHPLNTWVKQSPREDMPVPDLKYEGSGAVDPRAGRWIHFAGHDGIPQGFYLFTCDLAGGAWRQLFPNTSPPGVCCVDGANTFDVAQGKFVAFPGGSLGHGYQWSRGVKLKASHVWLYDPTSNAWTNMRPPPYREPEKYSRDILGRLNRAATYDANHEVSISFGGQGAGGPTNALWVYDAHANDLVHLKPPNPPAERDGMGLCYDLRHDCLVMFGSQYSNDERTWIYRFQTNRWEGLELDPHPPAKKEGTYSTNPKLAYDSAHGVCMCIVRRGEKSETAAGTLETWTLDVGQLKWTAMNPAVSPDPGASRARNLSYWPEANVFVLESVAASGGGMQIWTYRYQAAPREIPPAAPTEIALATEAEQARLRWRADARAAGYQVYRAQAPHAWEARFEKIATLKQPEFVERPPSGAPCFYRVTAVDQQGRESPPSAIVRNQPRVMQAPVVSVLATTRIEVAWDAHPAADVAGYNVYRGIANVQAVRKGEPAAWKDNDPEYAEPRVVGVRDITQISKLNDSLVRDANYLDTTADLANPGQATDDYQHGVYAYIVRAVNRQGIESGPSPYALTLPAEPQHVLLRESGGAAEIRWQPNREKSVTGYHVYKLGKSHWHIERVTDEPLREPRFRHEAGKGTTRYWIVPVDLLGQEGQPSSPVWYNHGYRGFFEGEWHQ